MIIDASVLLNNHQAGKEKITVPKDKKFVESIKFSYVKFLADLPSK